ncbi:hypothetical protein SASPL_141573 [Salvia splendens]|uniref:Uncharacterized protein n=1 Tax=Salvia splendens TaxID=180675 RepID=A0A8X8WTC5_SALSN|nr:hypothetical protein SASPL_141573 [Salvia splendens]
MLDDSIGQGGLYLFDELYNGVQEEIEQDQLNQYQLKWINQNMGQDASQVTPLLELILCLPQFTSTRIAIHNPLPNPL